MYLGNAHAHAHTHEHKHTHVYLRAPFKREPATKNVNIRLHQLHLPQRPAAVFALPELLHTLLSYSILFLSYSILFLSYSILFLSYSVLFLSYSSG